MSDWAREMQPQGQRLRSGARNLLPPEQEQTLSGIEVNRQKSIETFGRLRTKLADRPELQQRLADLGGKIDKSSELIAKLRYTMEFRHELKRMALKPEQVSGLIPSRDTPWGQTPVFVVGVKDQEGAGAFVPAAY